jgi:hypothetical protein
MRRSCVILVAPFLILNAGVMLGQAAPKAGPAGAAVKAPMPAYIGHPGEKETALPVRSVALYKNGVGFFEQAGQVRGDELVRIDFTTAQLNDALQSLTAVDLGDGRVAGAGYNSVAPLALQLNELAPGLGQDPTVMDFLHAMKGQKVEVHYGAGVFTGRLLNVEVRMEPEGKGSTERVERRYVSVVSEAGGLRTFELTPTVEVRLVGGERQEIGRYLELLAANHETHEPSLRHLMLEDTGTGERELHVSYLSAVPAWKSSYRILLTTGKDGSVKDSGTLQGWAVVDNTSGADWENVQLTLVSGAPQSFIQQISRPLDIQRPQIGMPEDGVSPKVPRVRNFGLMGAMADPLAGQGESVPVSAGAIGGGTAVQVHRAQQQQVSAVDAQPAEVKPVSLVTNYERAADKTLAPLATSVDMDDLFEYKLSKPITLRRSESATVPILQTEVGAKRVTVWNPHPRLGGAGPETPMRSLWLTNTSDLTLDSGSFSVVENGMFGGEGQIELMHPKERKLVAYARDESIHVDFAEGKRPAAVVGHIKIAEGKISVHREYPRVREYTITNSGGSARTVVLEPERTDRFQMAPGTPRIASVWSLAPDMPEPVEKTDKMYGFEVEVAAGETSHFKLVERHSHPTKYDLATMHEDELRDILKEIKAAGGNADVIATLQPLLDAKHQLAEVDKKLKAAQSAMDSVKFEEKRIRENMAALPARGSEDSLAKRYADEMNAQEDKMAQLQSQKDALVQQQGAIRKQMEDSVAGLQMETKISA